MRELARRHLRPRLREPALGSSDEDYTGYVLGRARASTAAATTQSTRNSFGHRKGGLHRLRACKATFWNVRELARRQLRPRLRELALGSSDEDYSGYVLGRATVLERARARAAVPKTSPTRTSFGLQRRGLHRLRA